MDVIAYLFLAVKLMLSLVYYLLIFFLEKIFANKFFLIINSLFTITAVILLIIILKTKPFQPPEKPIVLPIIPNENTVTLNLSQQDAIFLLNQQKAQNNQVSQKYYLNMANLNLITGDKQKADYFLKIARYINPNTIFIK